MFADYHVHTEFSDDSVYPMEQVIKDAIDMQMDEICFTDHVDYGIKNDWGSSHPMKYRGNRPLANVNYPVYVSKITELQSKYGTQIRIKMGLEFGVQTHTIAQYESLFAKYPFDFIILSIHQVDDKEFWTQDFQEGKSQKEYNERYYEEMLNVVKSYQDYSVLGHLDLLPRYDLNGVYPFEKVAPIIREILQIVIQNGKGLEINTSYPRYGLQDSTPSADILKLYRELGGKIITLGSDSHKPDQLGTYINEGKQVLKNLGFPYFCTYDNMQPIYHVL
ncbi:MAG: histidinol-phosphatase HisJ family protein [Hespellia sp.]|jgi:histidinol-phosphatase (PHP family)|nr:histidinol-phosphatase HisJ family protein [Hespellia sp.]